MIDLLIGLAFGAAAILAFQHFWPQRAKIEGQTATTIEAFGQVLEHAVQALHARFDTLESQAEPNLERIKQMIADALNDLKVAADAAKDKAVAEALAAITPDPNAGKAEQEAADEQAVRDFTAANFPAA